MSQQYPPRFFLRFFRWFCHPRLRDHIEGDLIETYNEQLTQLGKRKADIKFIIDVLLLFRKGIIKPRDHTTTNTLSMYKNYFKISIRHLAKNKTFAAINLFGLTVGFFCFILLALYIQDELSFDLFHKDSSRMYRLLQTEQRDDGSTRTAATVAALIGKESGAAIPEIEDVCRITAYGRRTFGNDPANRGYHALLSSDDNFFGFFDFPLLDGNIKEALKNPGSVVLSETLARKYFGSENPIGKRLWSSQYLISKTEFTVTGVMRDFPKNSHLQTDILFSESSWASTFKWYTNFVSSDWTSNTYVTYLKLRDNADPKVVASKISRLVQSHYANDKPFRSQFSLQPLDQIHLYSENVQDGGDASAIRPSYLYIFGVVGLLLLLTACFNYMNLATAAAIKRTREIGMRKSLGARGGQLVIQFVTDSMVLATAALMLALVLLQVFLPLIRSFLNKDLHLESMPWQWIMVIAGCIFFTAVLAAIYPAIIGLRTSITKALKGEMKTVGNHFSARKILLAAQFTVSIAMIASTLMIYRQLQYLRTKDVGVDVENLLVLDINSVRLRRNFENVKAEFSKPAEVLSISTSTRVPGEWKNFPMVSVNSDQDSRNTEMIYVGIDNDFLKTYGIKLKEGRNFNAGAGDSLKVILTELAVQQLGLKNPVGQIVEIPVVRWGGSIEKLSHVFKAEVIGVTEDFHFESLKKNMQPVIFAAPNTDIQPIDYYTLKIKSNNWPATIERLKEINQKLDPDNPLEYTFLNDRFAEFYQADATRGQLFLFFSSVIVVISCLGLFALVSYAVERRTKEIGIRKVLGASVSNIVSIVSVEFLVLVLFAGIVGLPLAWYFMRSWLQDFAYRVPVGVSAYAYTFVIALLLAFVTIGFKTIRAARENPVKSLRTE